MHFLVSVCRRLQRSDSSIRAEDLPFWDARNWDGMNMIMAHAARVFPSGALYRRWKAETHDLFACMNASDFDRYSRRLPPFPMFVSRGNQLKASPMASKYHFSCLQLHLIATFSDPARHHNLGNDTERRLAGLQKACSGERTSLSISWSGTCIVYDNSTGYKTALGRLAGFLL